MPRLTLPKPAPTFTGDDAELRNACARFFALDDAASGNLSGEQLGRVRDGWWAALKEIEHQVPTSDAGRQDKLAVAYRALADELHCEHGENWRADADPRSRVAAVCLAESWRLGLPRGQVETSRRHDIVRGRGATPRAFRSKN